MRPVHLNRRIHGLVMVLFVLFFPAAPPALADYWYEHYARAETALENGNWERAIEELQQALERKGDSGARVRWYGMRSNRFGAAEA